ncbi:hypothetical protein L2E82_30099 [Cichorium intybus]|uniref:Uncharacterized protein n=1 Tax=Cichorium intybus TaxID=13427 RepID=A0ACB9CZB2_CICIN|nr:hypothetical protein L2E82_30099 [Cichorium intybus]
MNLPISIDFLSTPLLSHTTTSSSSTSSDADESPASSHRFIPYDIPKTPSSCSSYRSLSVLTGHDGSVSSLAICGEFILSASHGKDIIVWQQPDLRQFTKFGQGDGSVKALVTAGNKVFTAHQDSRIRIKAWGRTEPKSSHSLKGILEGHKDISINSVVVSDDGTVVYGGGSDGYVMGWLGSKDFDSWKSVCEVKAHNMAILCMCIKGEILCSGSTDKSICIWKREIIGLTKIGVVKGHGGPIKCLQASPNSVGGGFLLYSGSLDKSIRVWWVPYYQDGVNTDDSNSSIQSTRNVKSVKGCRFESEKSRLRESAIKIWIQSHILPGDAISIQREGGIRETRRRGNDLAATTAITDDDLTDTSRSSNEFSDGGRWHAVVI